MGQYVAQTKQNKKKKQRSWATEEVTELFQQKDQLYKKILSNRTEDNYTKYKEKNREVRNTIKRETNMLWEEVWQTMYKKHKEQRSALIRIEE